MAVAVGRGETAVAGSGVAVGVSVGVGEGVGVSGIAMPSVASPWMRTVYAVGLPDASACRSTGEEENEHADAARMIATAATNCAIRDLSSVSPSPVRERTGRKGNCR